MALTFIHNKKIQEIFKDEQCSGKLSIDSSKNIGENGRDGKNKSSLYFSNIEIDNSYNKETILKALDENVIISTNEKMSREYVIGDLIMTPKLDIFCVAESKNNNHKFDLEQYGKIINDERTEYTDLRDSIIKIELEDVSTDTHVCPAPVNRSMEARANRQKIYFSIQIPSSIRQKNVEAQYFAPGPHGTEVWKGDDTNYYYTISNNHCIDSSVYDSSVINSDTSTISTVSFYIPSQMVYNYYVTPIDSTSNFDSSSQFDTSLFVDYQSANRQMYGLKFKPNIYLNTENIETDLTDYEFTLRIGLKNKKKYGSDSSYSYYLERTPRETLSKYSPYDDNNSVESDFFKNLYIPLNKIIDGNYNSSTNEEIFLSDVTLDRFHLFGNEYQSNIINTNMNINTKKIIFAAMEQPYYSFTLGTFLYPHSGDDSSYWTPIDISLGYRVENKEFIKSTFYANDTYYDMRHINPIWTSGVKINSYGYSSSHCYIQRPLRKIGVKSTIHYRSGESVYFSSIVPNDSSSWCNDYMWGNNHNLYNILFPNNQLMFPLNKFDDYVLLSHLSNPNAYETSTNDNTPTYADIKTKASNQIGLLVGQEMVKFLFNDTDNEYELICTNKKTQQVYYINLKNDYFRSKFIKNVPLSLTDFYYSNNFNAFTLSDLYVPLTYIESLATNDNDDNDNNDENNNNTTPINNPYISWQQKKQTYKK